MVSSKVLSVQQTDFQTGFAVQCSPAAGFWVKGSVVKATRTCVHSAQ